MHSPTVARTSTAGCTTDPGRKPPSAIAAFSDLVSTAHKHTHDSPPTLCIARNISSASLSTGLHSLPIELVRMIFQCVFEPCVAGDNPALWLDEDHLSPSLFPYALACVCRKWFQILQTVPVYWTRLVITVDTITMSLNAARTTLAWARHHPLKVIVTRHRGMSEMDDSERVAVRRAMQLLRPHIRRIWSLAFDVEHSFSIPALWRERGRARDLKVLTLLSRSDAVQVSRSSDSLPAWSSHEYEGKLKVPRLEDVTFSGHFLKHALMVHPRLANWFRHATSLTICGNAASGGHALSLHRFLSVIDLFPSIRELAVEDVHFNDNAPYPNLLTLTPAVLRLRRVTGNTALLGILSLTRASSSLQSISIIDCTVHGFRELDTDSALYIRAANLTLASMDSDGTIEDLVGQWRGSRLAVRDCPRMSHAFLERLHGDLSQLHIVDCEHFTAGDLIALVQARGAHAAFVGLMGIPVDDDDAPTALVELCVEGRGPPISVKRAKWLAEHVEKFAWDTIARDGLRYVWEGETGRLMVLPASGSLEVSTNRWL